jgi:hypothetical protein
VKTIYFICIALFSISNLASAANSSKPSQKALESALSDYLKKQGEFCIGKFNWPRDVSEAEFAQSTTPDALQLPVMEKLGLVTSSSASALRKIDETDIPVPVKRYELTTAGKQFYLPKESSSLVTGQKHIHHYDFCAGKLTVHKLVRWSEPERLGDKLHTTVTYTYDMQVYPWAQEPEIQKVFPIMTHFINGSGAIELEQHFVFSGKSWVAVNPLD